MFHFKYDTQDLQRRQKIFGRLIIYTVLLLLILITVDIYAQSTQVGWDTQDSTVTTDLLDVAAIDADNAWAVGAGGIILKTTDAGLTWELDTSPVSENLLTIDHLDGVIFAAGSAGKVIRNTGDGWTDVSPATTVEFRGISVAEATTKTTAVVFVAGNGGELWKSTDSGDTWVMQVSATTNDIYDIDFLNATWGLAVGTNGVIVGTLNGNTWSTRDDTPDMADKTLRGVKFRSATRAYITGDDGLFLRSEISGNPIVGFVWDSWSNTTTNLQFNAIDASSQNKVWIISQDGSVFLTKDGGNFFAQQKTDDITGALNGIDMVDGTLGFIVGAGGITLHTISGGVAANEIPTVKDYSDLAVYWEDTKDLFFSGFANMLRIIFFSMFIGFVLGIILAVMKTANSAPLKGIATIYTDFFRNTPLLVQFFIIHFGLPDIGIDLTLGGIIDRSFASSIVALALNTAAYQAEIIRGGIQAIPSGQMEAGRSLGLTYGQSMRYVILPQALRIVIPPLGNEFINLILNSSLASVVGYQELARSARLINAFAFKIFQTWLITALFYFVITYSLTHLLRYVEKRTKIPGLGFGGEN